MEKGESVPYYNSNLPENMQRIGDLAKKLFDSHGVVAKNREDRTIQVVLWHDSEINILY